jgi:hypothetical protein
MSFTEILQRQCTCNEPIFQKLFSYMTETSSCFDWACSQGHLDVVQYLYDKGVRPVCGFLYAYNGNHANVFRFLISKGFNRVSSELTNYSILSQKSEEVQFLTVDILSDVWKGSIFAFAYVDQNKKLCQYMCERGFDPTATLVQYQTVLNGKEFIEYIPDPYNMLKNIVGQRGFENLITWMLDDSRVYSKDLEPVIQSCKDSKIIELLTRAQYKVDGFKYNKIKEEFT